MAKNANLHSAKSAKNDEFYTQLTDVAKELMYYRPHFKDKVVFCNCDDPTWSAFWKYFHLNFETLGLKKLISTHYDKTQPTYKMEYTGGDDTDVEVGIKTPLEGNGDFRNAECVELLKEADIVVTNPPFSLFREYVSQLIEYRKKFLVIGNKNCITYKELFPLIRNNLLWLGVTPMSQDMLFAVPKSMEQDLLAKSKNGSAYRVVDGVLYARSASVWFTNLDHIKRHEKLILWKHYAPAEFPKYDNYDAVNIDRVDTIPCDYEGVMGVPITFLDKYNPDQFEIVAFRKGEDGKDLVFTREREREFNRTFVSLYDVDCRDDKKRRRQDQWEAYLRQNNNQAKIDPIDLFYPNSMAIGGCMNAPKDTSVSGQKKYARILIRRKVG